MKQYIIESASRAQTSLKFYSLFKRIEVNVTDPLPPEINLQRVIKDIESVFPKRLLDNVESIYIGNYDVLNSRQVDSIYVGGSIMVTNRQPNEKELFSTLIHEFAHAVEELAGGFIYEDGSLSREFIAKRKTLYHLLKDDYKINPKVFLDINYDSKFDEFIYKTIGYDNLGILTNGLFMSPYACTSLREYFANGVENYFVKDSKELRNISPVLYKKIKLILNTDFSL